MANKNFTVKNGLEVGGQEVISSSGAITSAALGGQVLGTSASPSFANITTAGYLRGPASFVIDPAAHGDDTGTVVIAGNLQVDGTQTTINSTTMTVDDLNITLASGAANAAAANGAGLTVDGASATLLYASSGDKFVFNKTLDVTGIVTAVGGNTNNTDDAAVFKGTGTEHIKLLLDTSSTGGHRASVALESNSNEVSISTTGSDEMRFSTATTSDALFIKSDGNVGIGTTTPSGKLTISSDAGVANQYINLLSTQSGSARNWSLGINSGDFRLFDLTANAERLRIDSNGTLGLKTTPKTWTIDGLQLGTNAALSEDANSIYLSANAYMNSGWKRTNNQLAGYLRMGTNDGIMSFSNAVTGSADSAISWVERFRVHTDGNVGIGITGPANKLHVHHANAALGFDQAIRVSTNVNEYTAGRGGGILMQNADVNTAGIYGIRLGGWQGALAFYTHTSTAGNTFGTTFTEKMRITDAGNVGIGVTNPSSALDIRGAGANSAQKNTIAFGTSGWGNPLAPNAALDGAVKLALFEGGNQKVQIGMDANARLWLMSAGSGAQGVDIYTGASNTVAPSLRLRVDQAGVTNAYGGVYTPLLTTNDIKASGSGGVSVQTDEGTKRIEVFDNGKITFNNLIYQSGINKNTINSGYDADSNDSDIWINYRGYNDGHTRTRDFRIGDGKGNAIAFFDGSEMLANIHSLKVHTGAFRAVGTLPSTAGMALTGVGLGQLSNYAHAQFSGSAGGYIDFAEPNVDWSGRIIYTHANDTMGFYANAQNLGYMSQAEWVVRGGANANQGKITFSTQSTAYNIIGGNYWGYTGINSGGHIRLGSNNGEQMRLGAGASAGNMALGLIGVAGANSEAAIHGKSNDSTLLLTNTDLSSNSTWGFTGRGARFLTSNGSTWTVDGKDAALVIGSNKATTQRGGGLGIVLHNESNVNGNYSPGLYFSTQAESTGYNTVYGYIMGAKTGSGVDTNWSTGEIHMDTAGNRTGTATRTAYMDGTPAFKIDNAGDVTMPYKAYAYGQINGNPGSPANNYGFPLTTTRYQNCTPTTNASHGPGITITKAGFYILNMSCLYNPLSHDYVYLGWCVNGSQIHHWHSNHTVSSNHDGVSQIGRYLNIGDHVSIENSNVTISTIYGNAHSAWYIAKIG